MMYWCLVALGAFTAVWWALFYSRVREPAEVIYPPEGGLIFSDNNN